MESLDSTVWMLLGEARSKCEYLAGAPLQPDAAQHLSRIALVKGVQATTAIEGNTLTEEQVAGILDGTFHAPPSREYQERKVKNVIDALVSIDQQITSGERPAITRELICELNAQVLDGTDYEPHVIPGRIRDYSTDAPSYLGAPAEDCEYLVYDLVEWLEGDTFRSDHPETRFALAVACAIYAHLYLAWLHPFGDGNGRTARLLEYVIPARSGMLPLAAAHLLTNHYNLTRDRYYRELAAAMRTGDAAGFIRYATEGLVDGLRELIEQVRQQQFGVTWICYVHDVMGHFPSSPARTRQRSLVLAMPSGAVMPMTELPFLDAELAALYARKGPRTLRRDVYRLRSAGLVVRESTGWRSNDSVINAFQPPIVEAGLQQ